MKFSALTCIAALSLVSVACGGDDDSSSGNTGGGAGSSGSAGASGAGGGAGSGGSAGSGGASGSAGSGGSSGSSGASGAGGGNGNAMSFFVSSTPPSGTGDLGGLAGADQHCKTLAQAVSAVRTQWVAYLSVENGGNGSAVNAKDRIGQGPWYNAKGEVLAANLAALHPTIDPAQDRNGYINAKPADALFMDETGAAVPGGQHDILTGSQADGTVYTGRTCNDWTSAAGANTAQVGHSDTPSNTQFSPSWNSAHDAQSCTQQGLIARGGNGRIYCFATD